MRPFAGFVILLGLLGCGEASYVSGLTPADIPQDTATDIKEAITATFGKEPKEQAKAVEYLEQMGARSAAAIPFLLRLTSERRLGADVRLDGVHTMVSYAEDALRSIGPLAADAMLTEWKRANLEQRVILARNLSPDPSAIEPLVSAIKDDGCDQRGYLVIRLGKISSPKVIPHLIVLLKDSDAEVREAAARALTYRIAGDFTAYEPLLACMSDATEEEDVRCCAVTALGVSKDPRAVRPLLDLLKDESESMDIRGGAAYGLRSHESEEALSLLITIARDKKNDRSFRDSAAAGLSGMADPRAAQALLDLLRESIGRDGIAELLCQFRPARAEKPQAIKIFTDVLDGSEDNRWVRAWVVYGLARSEVPAAYNRAVEAVQDSDEVVREASVGILALGTAYKSPFNDEETVPALSDPSVVEPLIAVLENKKDEPRMRRLAVIALRKTGDPRVVPPLIAALKDPRAEVRLEAAKALGQIEDARAVEGLQEARGDEHGAVRTAALLALCKMGEVDHYPADELTLDNLKNATRGYWE